MKKFLVLLAASMFMFGIFGCAKKQAEESQEPMTMEAMSTVNVATPIRQRVINWAREAAMQQKRSK